MGGHQSKQTFEASTQVLAQTTLNAAQDCQSTAVADQTIGVSGSGNVVTGNVQKVSFNIDTTCLGQTLQQTQVQNSIASKVSQKLNTTTQALFGAIDPSGSDVTTKIANTVKNNFDANTYVNCAAANKATQAIAVGGNSNVVANNLQEATIDRVAQCTMSGGQTAKMASDITNTASQYAKYTAKGPLANLFNAVSKIAMTGLLSWAGIAIAVVVVIVVGLLVFEKSGGKTPSAGDAKAAYHKGKSDVHKAKDAAKVAKFLA